MNWFVTVYVALLFFILTPGILLSLPPKSSKMVVAATHAVVFALVYHFTHKLVWQLSMNLGVPSREGMEAKPCPGGKQRGQDGQCPP